MPSFSPKLESTIKVMHRRIAKNDQKFKKKFCFSQRVITKVGKNKFLCVLDHFWPFYNASSKKSSKKYSKIAPSKRKNFYQKAKNGKFFLRRAYISQKCSNVHFFLFHNVLCSQKHRKQLLWSLEPYSRNEFQIPEKKTFLPKTRWG